MEEYFKKGIVFKTFEEAMDVHKQLFQLIKENGYVTCADLNYLIIDDEHRLVNEDDCNYGWTNLMETRIESCNYANGKWVLRMPKIKLLK